MNECPINGTCRLIQYVDLLPVLRNKIENYYCKKHFTKCARLNLHETGNLVPDNLLPNGKAYAQFELKG